jgi:hypothetical protein
LLKVMVMRFGSKNRKNGPPIVLGICAMDKVRLILDLNSLLTHN